MITETRVYSSNDTFLSLVDRTLQLGEKPRAILRGVRRISRPAASSLSKGRANGPRRARVTWIPVLARFPPLRMDDQHSLRPRYILRKDGRTHLLHVPLLQHDRIQRQRQSEYALTSHPHPTRFTVLGQTATKAPSSAVLVVPSL